jgi:hypothetical protein
MFCRVRLAHLIFSDMWACLAQVLNPILAHLLQFATRIQRLLQEDRDGEETAANGMGFCF